jgi:hypothetical protein
MFGRDLKAYVVYQIIELKIPQRTIACSLNRIFGFRMTPTSIKSIKASFAKKCEASYQGILGKIAAGPVVHADETKVMIGSESHYVWVFTSLNEVAYVHSVSRSSDTAQEILRGFEGVLVSDFYAGYDAINCPQQKCLVHLLRDLNDDVLKQPFNEEMVEVARSFAALLRPMVETVDRFGLKARYLRKHKKTVQQFYRKLSKCGYRTEVAIGYKKRFEKNRVKLFTFLDYDNVPWNNNNAEHAVKAFVQLRRIVRSNSTVSGIKQYLVLLTLGETCKYKNVDFLSFLRSGEMDIDLFADRSRAARVRKLPATVRLEPEPAAAAASVLDQR